MNRPNCWKRAGFAFVLCATTAIALPAQTFTTLFSFDSTKGGIPYAALIQATDGSLYGTTELGGANGLGTIFKITPGGKLTTLHTFDGTDGAQPLGALVQATDGNLYGTAYSGLGSAGSGTVFKITPGGTLTTLYIFCSQSGCADGQFPRAGLIQATDGNFYGTTIQGGANGDGTVFEITPGGTLTTLHSFDGTDGSLPYASLVQATDGNFYGTTESGGANGYGTVFKITSEGTLSTLHSFDSTDGADPNGLVQATSGTFYGTTYDGGANSCLLFGTNYGCGTVFSVTPSGTLTTLHSFDSTDGQYPFAALAQGTDGSFYGTTLGGGANESCVFDGAAVGCGTVFKITPSGTLTTLYSFCFESGCADGSTPFSGLVEYTNGTFYGTTYGGGASDACGGFNGCGTVFSLSIGLRPFVEPQTTSGKAGTTVKILGSDLTGASSVTFNGTAAVFVVESRSVIGATVPEGATSGTVEVTIPSGTLKSNVPFRVGP